MRNGIRTTALIALGLLGGITLYASAQTPGDSYPSQRQTDFSLDATVNQVDADRDRLIVAGDDGRTYTVDTYESKIALRNTDHPGQTADLVPGMRLHIVGSPLSRDLIEADRVSVLPYRNVHQTRPAQGPDEPASGQNQRVTLRGTVKSVDDRRGMLVVQVNDHTRKIFLSGQTELRDLPDSESDHIPVRPGDRVTVGGDLLGDGTVQATLLTPRRLDDMSASSTPVVGTRSVPDSGLSLNGDARHDHTLLGRVSKESGYISRDIKIRLSEDREITVEVPKNTPVRRDGRDISIHDVKDDQIVRISGDYDNDDFKAVHIDVLDDTDANRLAF